MYSRLIAGLPLAYVLIWFAIPLALMVGASLHLPQPSLEEYHDLTSVAAQRGLTNSLGYAAQSSLVAVVLGSVLLAAIVSFGKRWRRLIVLSLLLPFVANELVRTVAWLVVLGPEGPFASLSRAITGSTPELVKNRLGAVIGLVHVQLPFFVLTAMPVVLRVSADLRRAAGSLGANRTQVFLTVFLPLALPGLLAAWILIFILGLGYLATPTALGGLQEQTLVPALIMSRIKETVQWESAAALGAILLAVTLTGLALLARSGGLRAIYGGVVGGNRRRRSSSVARLWANFAYSRWIGRGSDWLFERRSVASFARILHYGVVVLLLAYLATPAFAAIPASLTSGATLQLPPRGLSLKWYEALLSDSQWTSAIATSLAVAAPVAVIATALGLCAAIALSRGFSSVGSKYLTVLLMPMLMPSTVLGLGLFFFTIAIGQAFEVQALVLAYTVMALPYTVIVLTASLSAFDWELDRAAQSLGASSVHRLKDILVPLVRPAILVSIAFAFLTGYTELFFALLMQTIDLSTLPVRMYIGIRFDLSPLLAVAASLTTFVTLGAFLLIGVARAGRGTIRMPSVREWIVQRRRPVAARTTDS